MKSLPRKSHDGIWRSDPVRTLAELTHADGTGRRESVDFTVAEMRRLNRWLTKRKLNVTPTKWSG